MSKIKLNLTSPFTGQQISFIAPCSSLDTECLVIEDIEYSVVDADGKSVAGVENVWNSGAIVSAILNVDSHSAFIQNANTNTYLEATMVKKTDYATLGGDYGLVKLGGADNGFYRLDDGTLTVYRASPGAIYLKKSNYAPITPSWLDYAVKVALTTSKGEIKFGNTIYKTTMTQEEREAACSWIGALCLNNGGLIEDARIFRAEVINGGDIFYHDLVDGVVKYRKYIHEGNIDLLDGISKMETVSYVGAGVIETEDVPHNVTFSFPPDLVKIVAVFDETGKQKKYTYSYDTIDFEKLKSDEYQNIGFYFSDTGTDNFANIKSKKSVDGKTLYWHGTQITDPSLAYEQADASGYTYVIVAIGGRRKL